MVKSSLSVITLKPNVLSTSAVLSPAPSMYPIVSRDDFIFILISLALLDERMYCLGNGLIYYGVFGYMFSQNLK